jgi:predicted Rossmann-fold nucleotide-binding protein
LQVFVSGTWSEAKAAPFVGEAELLGRAIADHGLDLACGPGTGIARHVIDGYLSRANRGVVRYYLPLRAEMEAVGEPVNPGADEIVETEFDYPMRNVYQVQQSHGLFVLTGGDGTLEEILPAVIDYRLPVAIIEDAGSASIAMKRLVEIYPEWTELVVFGRTVGDVVDEWLSRVSVPATKVTGL